MSILYHFAPLLSYTATTCPGPFSHKDHFMPSSMVPPHVPNTSRAGKFLCSARSRREDLNGKDFNIDLIKEDQELEDEEDDDGYPGQATYAGREAIDIDVDEIQEDKDDIGGYYSAQGPYTGRQEKDYDRDPELGEILGNFVDDPQKAQSKMEDRLRKKRNKILHTKTGSGIPMKVSFKK